MTAIELRSYRTGLGWTQAELAVHFGVSTRALRHWESGDRPVPATIDRLVYAWGEIDRTQS